jgi:hypothetical protein
MAKLPMISCLTLTSYLMNSLTSITITRSSSSTRVRKMFGFWSLRTLARAGVFKSSMTLTISTSMKLQLSASTSPTLYSSTAINSTSEFTYLSPLTSLCVSIASRKV